MSQQKWTREQDLAVLYIKLEHKERLTPTHSNVQMLAKAMKRTEAAIWMRKGNFDSLEVWPESHWSGFALRQVDVLQSYTA